MRGLPSGIRALSRALSSFLLPLFVSLFSSFPSGFLVGVPPVCCVLDAPCFGALVSWTCLHFVLARMSESLAFQGESDCPHQCADMMAVVFMAWSQRLVEGS